MYWARHTRTQRPCEWETGRERKRRRTDGRTDFTSAPRIPYKTLVLCANPYRTAAIPGTLERVRNGRKTEKSIGILHIPIYEYIYGLQGRRGKQSISAHTTHELNLQQDVPGPMIYVFATRQRDPFFFPPSVRQRYHCTGAKSSFECVKDKYYLGAVT